MPILSNWQPRPFERAMEALFAELGGAFAADSPPAAARFLQGHSELSRVYGAQVVPGAQPAPEELTKPRVVFYGHGYLRDAGADYCRIRLEISTPSGYTHCDMTALALHDMLVQGLRALLSKDNVPEAVDWLNARAAELALGAALSGVSPVAGSPSLNQFDGEADHFLYAADYEVWGALTA